jgi:pimeloyl-ACP methyl ester carboxylesterase
VVELADALGVDEFGVIAWSGGGPYAAVCAARILGCGEVFGDPIPPNLCGGAVKMRVLLTTPLGELPGIMTVICVIGPKAPSSVLGPRTDGVMLNVPGIINFNHSAGGDNVYIQTS